MVVGPVTAVLGVGLPPRVNLKARDTGVAIPVTFLDGNMAPVNLTGATVVLHVADQFGTPVISAGACVIVSGVAGQAQYRPGTSDFTVADEYQMEFLITLADAKILRVPESGAIRLVVTKGVV